jgi:hypothetical protein
MLNPELQKGDKVILLHMEGEMMSPGSKGTVINVSRDPFEKEGMIYNVKWDEGSTLSLLSVTDAWKKIEPIQESSFENAKWFLDNRKIAENFNTQFLTKYLEKIRESGITNMFGASPYLYMGKDRIEHEFKYKDVGDEEAFEEMLEMADESQHVMINGVMKVLEKENKEADMGVINRYIQRYATTIVNYWMRLH